MTLVGYAGSSAENLAERNSNFTFEALDGSYAGTQTGTTATVPFSAATTTTYPTTSSVPRTTTTDPTSSTMKVERPSYSYTYFTSSGATTQTTTRYGEDISTLRASGKYLGGVGYTFYSSKVDEAFGYYMVSDPTVPIFEYDIPAEINGYPVTAYKETFVTSDDQPKQDYLSKVNYPNGLQSASLTGMRRTRAIFEQPDGYILAGDLLVGYQGDIDQPLALDIPEGVVRIQPDAFNKTMYCDPASMEALPEHPVLQVVPYNVYNYFDVPYHMDITSLKLPSTLESIGKRAFIRCFGLKEVQIPEKVTAIEDEAFYLCPDLETVTLPDGLETIGERAFCMDYNLKSINLPDTVTKIGAYAFAHCINLEEIHIPESVTQIDAHAFEGCVKLKSVSIPKSVRRIDDCAFHQCESLRSVTIYNPACEIHSNPKVFNNLIGSGTGFDYVGSISGYVESTAQQYANFCRIKFIPLTDEPPIGTDDPTTTTTTTNTTTTTTETTTTTTKTETTTTTEATTTSTTTTTETTTTTTTTTMETTTTTTTTETTTITTTETTTLPQPTETTTTTTETTMTTTNTTTCTTTDTTGTSGTTTLPEKLIGDVNADGKVDYYDAGTLVQCILKKLPLTPAIMQNGDLNEDGVINMGDTIILIRYLNRFHNSLPYHETGEFADEPGVGISVERDTYKPAETFTATVRALRSFSASGLQGSVAILNAPIVCTGIEVVNKHVTAQYNEAENLFVFYTLDGEEYQFEKNEAIFTLEFAIAEDAADGKYFIAAPTDSYNIHGQSQTGAQKGVWVNVDQGYTETTTTTPAPNDLAGDMDKDGTLRIVDAVLLARLLAEDTTLTEKDIPAPSAADVDGDGMVTMLDLTVLFEKLLMLR